MRFVLHFISPVTFSDFLLTFVHLSQLPRNNIFLILFQCDLKKIIFPFFHSLPFALLDIALRSFPLNVEAYGTRAIWWLDFKPVQLVNFSARWTIFSET